MPLFYMIIFISQISLLATHPYFLNELQIRYSGGYISVVVFVVDFEQYLTYYGWLYKQTIKIK